MSIETMCYCTIGIYERSKFKKNPSWCLWNFFIEIKSFRSHYGPGDDSASNRNEYQEYFLGIKAAGA